MSSLKRAVNVSRFLASGNTLSPSSASSTTANYPASDDLDLDLNTFDDDLAKFTNLEWSEFDLQGSGGGGAAFETAEGATDAANTKRLKMEANVTGDGSGEADWSTSGGATYNPFEINTPTGTTNGIDATTVQPFDTSSMAQTSNTPPTAAYHHHNHHQPQQSAYPTPLTYLSQPYPSTDPSAAAEAAAAAAASPPPPQQSLDDNNPAARAAAEEDKRRRNTAASARFRVKKKQREQALEKTAEELKAKAQELEQQVGQLQRENEWLRGLVVLKSGEPVASAKEERREERNDGAKEDPLPTQVQPRGGKDEVASKEEKVKKGYGTA